MLLPRARLFSYLEATVVLPHCGGWGGEEKRDRSQDRQRDRHKHHLPDHDVKLVEGVHVGVVGIAI